jgi:hypothetical protein
MGRTTVPYRSSANLAGLARERERDPLQRRPMTTSYPMTEPTRVPAVDSEVARRIVEDSIRSYFRKRRSRVPAFVDATFSLSGALETHANAFGHDLWRAPLNLALAAPQLGISAIANGFERAGRRRSARWLRARELYFRTSVSNEIERRLIVDLLELPYAGPGRPSFRDALAVEIISHESLAGALGALAGHWGIKERARLETRLAEQVSIYLNARASAGELAGAAVTLGTGAIALHQFTPGFLTFGPALAEALSARIAGSAAAMIAGGGTLAASALASAFSGVVTDPIQRALGFHHARLVRLLDALETAFLGGDEKLRMPEQYAARLIELLDAITSVVGHARVA